MPKSTKHNRTKNKKVIHPNSRKACKIGKKAIHWEKVNNVHNQTVLKHTLLRDKLLWVKDYIAEDERVAYSRQDLCDIVESYLERFDEELEQIGIIKGIASRRSNQHASRAAAINLTLSKERTDYETCGIEMPDLCNRRNLKLFLTWDGELRYLQRIKLRRVKKMAQMDDSGDDDDIGEHDDNVDDDDNDGDNHNQNDRQEKHVAEADDNPQDHDNRRDDADPCDDEGPPDDEHRDDDAVLDVFDEELEDGSEKT